MSACRLRITLAENMGHLMEMARSRTSSYMLPPASFGSKLTMVKVLIMNNGHRAKFIKYVKEMERGGNHQSYVVDDEYSLGIHLCSPMNTAL